MMSDPGARVPVPVEGVAAVPVEEELVLLHEPSQKLHALDAVGALLWSCFDGTSSVREIAVDVADAFGIGVDAAVADIDQLVDTLMVLGLLRLTGEEVRPERADDAPATGRALPNPPDP